MAVTVLLVRHGQTDSNITGFYMGWSGEDLNPIGYAQARQLSSRLANTPLASVYTSPLRRAYTTAGILAEPHQITPTVLDDLIEIRLGDWQGLHMDEIKGRWGKLWQQWRTDPSEVDMPNGESFEQVNERALRALATIVEASRDKQVAIVTHDIIIKVLVAHAFGVSSSIYRRFDVNNASLSVIQFTNGKYRLTTLNDTSHLED